MLAEKYVRLTPILGRFWLFLDSLQELAERQEEEAVIVVRIPRADWLWVCRYQGRGRLLVLAE